MGKLNRPGILEIITNWPEGENFGLTDEQEQVTRAEEAPPYNQLPAEETHYALFTDGSCRIVGMNRKWKAAVWSPTRQVIHDCETCAAITLAKQVKPLCLIYLLVVWVLFISPTLGDMGIYMTDFDR
ncbi:hypothetical protein DUI87_02009 [Hirundo rustica rustica]|uniref:RNase H type-1 domain-containing protein n=1 Tax=Hirundo rustica rustica TaxID=333673 RepID=A0A3M0L7T0_HIRRU|nr:hypothetical protein DUI87_02009 [Hirundo rustica rustica]